MITFLNSITNMFLNIFGFFTQEPVVVLFAICLVLFAFGAVKWLF